MRTVTSEIQILYEEHDFEELADFGALINGLREHVDRINTVCSIVKRIAPKTVLDVGCNRGLFGGLIRWSHGTVKHVVGVDISRIAAKFARDKMKYDFVQIQNASEPFNLGDTFDLVLCMEILEHVPSPETVIENVKRHMHEHSLALFSCPNEQGELDGEFHVRHVSMDQLQKWIAPQLQIRDAFTLESQFCEKPKWQGWHFVLASK